MANILYLGADNRSSTSLHRAMALQRLNHDVTIKNPNKAAGSSLKSRIWSYFHYRTGYRFLQPKIESWISKIIQEMEDPDLIWVDSGELLGKKVVEKLNTLECPVILYTVDDITGRRDGKRFDSLLEALPKYDFVVVVRNETAEECRKIGCDSVKRVFRSYDEVAHRPFSSRKEISQQFESDVAFIGTWMRGEGRDKFMLALAEAGIPITIWGDRWQKSPFWTQLKSYYRGGGLSGRDYVAAMQGAKVCIGLLSKGNRDLHTQRSLEIPYAGGLLCAERTMEHLELYEEDKEAVFWEDADECVQKCKVLLTDNKRREQIRQAGMQRVRELKVGNEDICQKILGEVTELSTKK